MILIVDDDAAARDSLRLLLECEGYEAREFASGREFFAAGGAGEGDCLILDVNMPGMSRIELLETMRRRGDLRPVIVISHRTDAWTESGLTPPGRSRSSMNHTRSRTFSNWCARLQREVSGGSLQFR